jgi:hypothetical protein
MQEETSRGIEPHPDFTTYSDSHLELRQGLIDQKIAWAKEDGDDFGISWYEIEMQLLQAERARRNGVNSHNSLNSQSLQVFPTIHQAAFHGLAGEIVEAIEPHSEADPVAILVNVLTAVGSVIGSGPHFLVEKSEHHLNLFVVQVGKSAKGRKGTAWSTPKHMLKIVDPDWAEKRVKGGLSSGEGLVYAVRDQRIEKKPYRESGRIAGYEDVMVDEGEVDKRLLCVEEEFVQALKVMAREGNILSPILRDAWDGNRLAPMTKNNPLQATGAHVSIIAHITRDELLRYFTSTEQTNGFGNRFVWFFVRRSREIPNPTGCPDGTLKPLIERLAESVSFARKVSTIRRDDEAEAIWAGVYHDLSADKDGLAGALLARAEPQVMRFASIYALLDLSNIVQSSHLEAALALWSYSEQSVHFIFGELKGDPSVDKAFEALKKVGCLTVTDIHNLFGRHADKNEVDRVVKELLKIKGVTSQVAEDTGGRPSITLIHVAN